MKPGQRMTDWWQRFVRGEFTSPRDLVAASRQELPDVTDGDRRFLEIPDYEGWQAPERLQAPRHFLTDGFLRQHDRADWQHVDRRLMRWAAVFTELARKRGIPLYVHCALRTEAEQAKVNHAGNSKALYPRSAHNIGEAVDIVHGVFHWDLTRQEWSMLHVLGRRALDLVNRDLKKVDQLHITWGGDFKSLYDPAHWEITDYRARIRRLPLADPLRYTPRGILARIKL